MKLIPVETRYTRGRMIFISKRVTYRGVFDKEKRYTGLVQAMVQTKGDTYRNPDRHMRKNAPKMFFKLRRLERKYASCLSSK